MHILNGNTNISLSRSRLAALNAALLQKSSVNPLFGKFAESPVPETDERRISYMDLDSEDFINLADQSIPPLPPALEAPAPVPTEQPSTSAFVDPGKPSNPLAWCYPNYYDAAPTFEESDYYDRPSFGQIFTKPLQKIGSRLGSRNSSPHSRPMSQAEQHEMNHDYPGQVPMHHQHHHPEQQPVPQHLQHSQHFVPQQQAHPSAMRHPFRGPDPHAQLHLFTPQT
jgi:hypothetical protein